MRGHTPGPWSVGIAPKSLTIFGDSTFPRTVVARVPNVGYPIVSSLNASLIAAAPELSASLEWALARIKSAGLGEGEQFAAAEAVLVKAVHS